MGTPHKHAELIKAWADGLDIDFRYRGYSGQWIKWIKWDNQIVPPFGSDDFEFRATPQPIARYINIYQSNFGYDTRKDADIGNIGLMPRIACLRIEYTEGQFDE